ncbi:MAG: gephyrin-like molybdotransferase Glp [Hyphomonas sp.]|uniref:molybdopterin molybdotransferase MoeA n=1 Tax=Hyphomonas sp. TaxID=87 RepID=UPI003001BE91
MSGLISVDEAIAHLVAYRPAPVTETVPLADALGRTLAVDVAARVTLPPHDASAMDGYAVRIADIANAGTILQVIGEAPAGTPFKGSVGAGEAVRIFTGSAIPEGADHVLIQEHATRNGDRLTATEAETAPRHIRRAGIDFKSGETLLHAGQKLGPAEIAVAAAADHATLSVHKRLRLAILANGDELRPPGSDPAKGDVVSSNSLGLAALIHSWGGEVHDLGIATDSVESIQALIRQAHAADIILPVGGASVGDHDHMVQAFKSLGLTRIFQKIAVKPGKPTWFGLLGNQRVLGMPGNPASAIVCAHLFLKPLIATSLQLDLVNAHITHALAANGPRESFLRCVASVTDGIGYTVEVLPNQDSSLIKPFLQANCLVRRECNATALHSGDLVQVLLI